MFNTDELFEYFTATKCATLIGKPKLFFIQACQGEKFDDGALAHDAPKEGGGGRLVRIPNYADILIFYSTYPGRILLQFGSLL